MVHTSYTHAFCVVAVDGNTSERGPWAALVLDGHHHSLYKRKNKSPTPSVTWTLAAAAPVAGALLELHIRLPLLPLPLPHSAPLRTRSSDASSSSSSIPSRRSAHRIRTRSSLPRPSRSEQRGGARSLHWQISKQIAHHAGRVQRRQGHRRLCPGRARGWQGHAVRAAGRQLWLRPPERCVRGEKESARGHASVCV